jgi:diguanylate cyclase (GGDEF)-like protein/PAS domain S-box-containing protein
MLVDSTMSLDEKIMTLAVLITIVVFISGALFYFVRFQKKRLEFEQKNNLLEAIFNQVTDSVVVLDEEGIIQMANDQFLSYIEKSAEKIIGKSIQRIQTDYDFSKLDELRESFAQTGSYEKKINFYHKSGDVIPINLVFKPVMISDRYNKPQTFLVITGNDLSNAAEKDEYINQQADELQEIQRLAHLGYWEMNYLSKKIYWSRELYSILGFEEGEVEPNLDMIYWMAYKDDQNRVWKAFLQAFQAQEKVDTHYRIKNNRGEIKNIYLRIRHYFTKTNEHVRTIGILQDVSKQVILSEELNAQQVFTDKILNNSSMLFIEFNHNFEVKNINQRVSQLCGFSNEEASGKSLVEIFGNLNRTHRKFVNENLSFRKPLPFKDIKGNIHHIQWDHATIPRYSKANQNIILGIDVTEIIEKRKALEDSFFLDRITKLPNRCKLEQVLENYFKKNGQNSDKNLALIFVHVEGIHNVGDAYGQQVEDQLMRALSERLYQEIGKYGLFVRRYTDQFVLFYPCGHGIGKIMDICNQIVGLMKMPFIIGAHSFRLNNHIGISQFPNDTLNKEDLVRFGSAAMHEAQRLNLDYYFFHHSLEKKLKDKVNT